jgi:glycosyltransferase involved in cell wall biosynthesis
MPDRDATVVIVTKDRRDDALQAVESALGQKPRVEVVVVDDGSQDGTAGAVADAFPEVRVERHEQPAGLVVRRNEAARLASAPIIVSIDDDAIFTDTAVVANAVAAFDDPRVAAVAIPYVDVPQGEQVLQAAPDGGGVYVTHRFRGTAHALRKDVFVELGGYRAELFQQTEEPDFAVRLLDAGYVVRLGWGEPVRHFASPKRDLDRGWFYESRNEVLFAWHNVPMPDLVLRLAKVSVNTLRLGFGVHRPGLFARGLAAGFAAVLRGRVDRRPVSREAWRLYERLGRRSARIEEIEAALPKERS